MSLNQFVFHFQKLGLELKCPQCLNLLNWPILLPCDHIFCNSCVNKSPSQCLTCQSRFGDHEARHSPYLENIVAIYKSLDLAFNLSIVPLLSADIGAEKLVSTPSSKLRKKHHETLLDGPAYCAGSQNESVETGVNRVSKASPLGVHSSEDVQDEDYFKTEPVGKKGKRRAMDKSKKSVGSTVTSNGVGNENTSQTREPKRQKELNNKSSERVLQRQVCKHKEAISVSPSTARFNASDWELGACAFCHSTKITEWTGPLLHFAGGKEVAKDDTGFPNATPVHRQCLLWSPQIYHVGNEVQNLDAELMRSSKLTCSGCGLKGASLGCFVNLCQTSYHPPCAAVDADCRWDCDEYLMLCPRHANSKFPNEKSNSGKRSKMGDRSKTTKSASKWTSNKKWIFCASALSSKEKITMDKFAKICGATVFDTWNPNVTHVITSTDSNDACKRTMEVLMAILNGRWVVTADWIKACLKANCPVNEEPYEVDLDNDGVRNGPKTGRLRAAKHAPKLFDGLKFFFHGDFAQKLDLFTLVRAGGGAIIDSLDDGHDSKDTKQKMGVHVIEDSKTMIVFNQDPEGCVADEATYVVLQRLEDAEDLAEDTDARVIPHTWILGSVAACRKLPYP